VTFKFGQRVVRVGVEGNVPIGTEGTVFDTGVNGNFVVKWDDSKDGDTAYNTTEFYGPESEGTIVAPKACQ
jgi:hypothetical protein